jgi:hypothetical protein
LFDLHVEMWGNDKGDCSKPCGLTSPCRGLICIQRQRQHLSVLTVISFSEPPVCLSPVASCGLCE